MSLQDLLVGMRERVLELHGRFVAVVCCGDDEADLGVLVEDFEISKGKPALAVLWPDGHAHNAYRDARGWYWDEYGEDKPPRSLDLVLPLGTTRLPVHSRGSRKALELLARHVVALEGP